jgi:hypothetical protein
VAGAAPKGAVLNGTWSIQQYTAAGANEVIPVPISTGVPVRNVQFVVTLKKGENLPGQSTGEREEIEAFCPGSADEPAPSTAAEAGVSICLYVKSATNLKPPAAFPLLSPKPGESAGGNVVGFETNAAGVATGYGSWSMVAG